MAEKDDLRKLFPGRELKLHDGEITITVYPLGVVHLRKFSQKIEEIIPKILSSGVDLEKLDDLWGQLSPMIMPIVANDLLELVNECVEGVDLLHESGLPHWFLPMIMDAWIEESFGSEGKVRPWIEAMDSTITRVTGQSLGIWDTLSKGLSAAATRLKTSSTDSNKESHTEDGQSPNSASGPSEPQIVASVKPT